MPCARVGCGSFCPPSTPPAAGSGCPCCLCGELRALLVLLCILRADGVLSARALSCDGGVLPWAQSLKVHRSRGRGPPPSSHRDCPARTGLLTPGQGLSSPGQPTAEPPRPLTVMPGVGGASSALRAGWPVAGGHGGPAPPRPTPPQSSRCCSSQVDVGMAL